MTITVTLRILIVSIIAATFAGCLGPLDEPTTSSSPAQNYEDCEFRFPDGSPVPCRNEATPTSAFAVAPDGWICVAREGSEPPSWRILRSGPAAGSASLLGDDVGLEFHVKSEDVSAVMRFASGDSIAVVNWTSPSGDGFVRIPGLRAADSASFFAEIYRFRLNSPDLPGASLDQLWSWRASDEFWVIHRVQGHDRTLYLQRMVTLDNDSYVTADLKAQGPDFQLTIESGVLLRGGTQESSISNPLSC